MKQNKSFQLTFYGDNKRYTAKKINKSFLKWFLVTTYTLLR